MRPPCPHTCHSCTDRRAVFGYGDANADVHVIGDNPAAHGGAMSGIPFTGHGGTKPLLALLERTGFVAVGPDGELSLSNCFLSYRYCCCLPEDTNLNREDYAAFEPFFDAELRAIAADVLAPIGEQTTRHVLSEYTAQSHRITVDMARLHATQIKGRGFIVFPLADPSEWAESDATRAEEELRSLLDSDYRQLVDLGRFLPDNEPYFVR